MRLKTRWPGRAAWRYALMVVRYLLALAMLAVAVVLASAVVAAIVAGMPLAAGTTGVYAFGMVLAGWVAWFCWPADSWSPVPDPDCEPAPWDAEGQRLERLWRAPARHPPHDPPPASRLRPAVPDGQDPLERTIRDVVARHAVVPRAAWPARVWPSCGRCGGAVLWTSRGWDHADDDDTRRRVIIADAETFPDGPW